ncbi:glycosyltransferase [Halioglobus maricola]|uniref:Glycosyltransferase n=1 Tax=Halioglobus maricola TaxID=2601894 RepID=A0A5P9NP66_9GAMM|nr:glycosyltransferase [Halioglobus maricola]QFU76698.1 glycosyltransferase [Halioglobus maricola]
MSKPKKLIVVLGAHRSGTSLCAAAIEALGADACLGEHYANAENSKGFFEHPDIVDFNDRLLSHLGGSWDNPLFDGAAAIASADLAGWSEAGSNLLQGIYGKASVAVLKDPRVCQLLDFWKPVFVAAGYESADVYYVHTLRDPVEVALSQRSRALANEDFYEFGRELPEGAALWLSLTAQALSATQRESVYYVSYAGLMTAAENLLEQLMDFTGLQAEPARARAFCESFVDSELYRSSADIDSRELLQRKIPQVLAFDAALAPVLDGGRHIDAVLEACLAIANATETRCAMMDAVSPALSRLSDSCRDDRLERRRGEDVITDLQAQASELAENARRMQQEHQAVVEPLEAEVKSLQAGTGQLQTQLAEQGTEIARVSQVAEEHWETIGELETTLEEGRAEWTRLEDELGNEIISLGEQRDFLDERIHEMEQSSSWRLTRPLRSLSFRLQRLRAWSSGQWVQLRLKAILLYHRMSLRQPAVAWTIRRLVRPFFRLTNRLLNVEARDMHTPASAGLLTPMRYQQEEEAEDFDPLVSVIVPNYNHAPYLRLRLESIFSQTYENYEVILLDDASSDDSAEVLREFHERYPSKSTLVINEENSGGVFHQWERGLNLAAGDIVWIAESDDWCTENFLETLVPYFENEAITLAYARTVFMDGEGEKQIWSINEYLHDIDPQRWNAPIVETGPAMVRQAFAVKNIVPNVSSALFRTPRQLEILKDPQWRKMRTCGDWVLYLHLLRGGMLAYSPEACNYYRQHGQNTSVKSHSEDEFYREHELVAKTVQRYFSVPAEVFSNLRDNLEIHWRETRGEYTHEALESCYSLARIEAEAKERAPNLLMASYAFCSGGGETFPVSLANIMKQHGYNVTYLDCAREPRIEGVYQKLRKDIPIVSDFGQLERIIDDFEIDLVHSHHAWMDSTILDILPEDVACKTVVTLHGMYETINEYDLRPILPRLVKRSARLIYVAEKNLEAIDRHGLLQYARTSCIDNALEHETFEVITRQNIGVPDDAFVFTLVSRAMAEKGWQEAIDAVEIARSQSDADIHLLLVGDGPEYDRLLNVELPGHVHLQGFQRNVRGYFALADVGFLPSRFRGESFPLVIIECLQTGVPFLASDLGEISRMLSSQAGPAGSVVPLQGDDIDIAALAAEMARLSSEPTYYAELRAAVAAAASKFDPAVLARKHDEAYRLALQEPGPRDTA